MGDVVFHFSEDPAIRRFTPHVPVGNPTMPPLVWAIDPEHAPAYWFPRECPRVAVWARDDVERELLRSRFSCEAGRLHFAEARWFDRIHATTVQRYALDPEGFDRWTDAYGHWVSREPQTPLSVEPVTDLAGMHAAANIELRFVPTLWSAHDLAVVCGLPFSIIRIRNAAPRT